ncbi:4-diphosphocytidyl-2-C-methyl-D-erythritol kinase [Naumannella cuiyingiana]|uniref:4-diphosphocytidyl-2-C-methyl-D-erythritol kinase n=1 Tax=Naumannella cuiyingiana TaxID=1347891 RepID=A0A7Z0DAF7_9ACTN|nr:4-diphosphocytidyl-2-C-methyl-D-erythritol kinase [Naumannella cuiyingiana]
MVSEVVVNRVVVRVPAKINLSLAVGARAADGYHPLATVFEAVSLFDEVHAEEFDGDGIDVLVAGAGAESVPTGEDNLAVRAARLLAERYDIELAGLALTLRKAIPTAGGMAGGSADAAGTLLACSVLWDIDIDADEMRDLAAELGSDVPFALLGGTAIGTGRGTELVPVLSRGRRHWVLVFDNDGLSTADVYRRYDELRPKGSELAVPDELMNALTAGSVVDLAPALRNDLAEAAIDLRPDLEDLLARGVEAGALAGMISGSGPTCAFLCRDESTAIDVSGRLARDGAGDRVRRVVGPAHGARLLG